MRLFTYKLTHDTGFAPNPFHGYLTLATCKPGIRQTKVVGEWVAGFTSKALVQNSAGIGGTWEGIPRLIYLMKITDKLSIAEYFADLRFACKVPRTQGSAIDRSGDNIYRPRFQGAALPSEFEIIDNPNHPAANDHIATDLSGASVLVSEEFYYFGRKAVRIPDEFLVSVPNGPSRYGQRTEGAPAQRMVDYISQHYDRGLIGMPHMWNESASCGSCNGSATAAPKRCVR